MAIAIAALFSAPASGAVLRAEYRWDTTQALQIGVSADGTASHQILSSQDYNSCGGSLNHSNSWGTSAVTVTPATSNGSTGVDITIAPFYPTPVASFQAYPWPNRCEYTSPGFVPTTVSVRIYLDDALVSSGSRHFAVFAGISGVTWQEVASYPVRPRFMWALPDAEQKVLLHKYRADDTSGSGGYYSIYQQPHASVADAPVMRVPAAVEENATAVVRDVWLRVADPPNTAPYETAPAAGDNLDPGGALLYAIKTDGTRVDSAGGILHVESDHEGITGNLRIFLQTSSRYAGENYRIEAALDPTFACATTAAGCPKSPMFTTWKRIYLERDSMFRAGTFLKSTSGGGSTSSVEIPVIDKSPFSGARSATPIPAVFIHAPNYNGTGPRDRYLEYRNVIKTAGTGSRQTITIDRPLDRTYGLDTTSPLYPSLPDAVGVYTPTTANQLYFADVSMVFSVFEPSFVEYRLLDGGPGKPNAVQFMPYYPSLEDPLLMDALAKKWCDMCETALPDNHQYLGGASTSNRLGTLSNNGVAGLTKLDQASAPVPYSYVFIEEIARVSTEAALVGRCGSIPVDVWVRETATHELVHQWDVNPPTDTTNGHCARRSWRSTPANPEECGMHRVASDPTENVCDRWDGDFALHEWSDAASEYRRIRSQFEPLPQTRQR